MSGFTVLNKLSGKADFVLEGFSIEQMPESGIIPMPVVLEERIGSEMGLFLVDKTPFIYEMRKVEPFNLLLKSGVVRTKHGPLMFLLFHVPNPAGGEPVVAIDCHLNPHNRNMMRSWRDLARQSHWHLILVDAKGEEVGFYEFSNTFDLGEKLETTIRVCEGIPARDFDQAKAEFCEMYSLADLFEMN